MFQLLAVIGGADVDAGDQVGPVEQAVVGADIEKLNWENVARVADLFFGKQQRYGLQERFDTTRVETASCRARTDDLRIYACTALTKGSITPALTGREGKSLTHAKCCH